MHVSTSMRITSLSQIPTLILFNTILSLVGYMGHNYTRIGGKITPNFCSVGMAATGTLSVAAALLLVVDHLRR